jgi:hypothetical protein
MLDGASEESEPAPIERAADAGDAVLAVSREVSFGN